MPFDWTNPYPTIRSPLFARNVVATSQPLAAQAGLQMLHRQRVDLFAANDRNCQPVLQQLGLGDAIARCSPPLDVLHGHMAFGRSAAGEVLAQRYDQAFERWLRLPEAAELYRRWGVERPATPN